MNLEKIYNDLPPNSDLVQPFWQGVELKMKEIIFPEPPEKFLLQQPLQDVMYPLGVNECEYPSKQDRDLLEKEFDCGLQQEFNNIRCSANYVRQLYHIHIYERNMEKSMTGNILEWGGGYGALAKLSYDLGVDSYNIVDIPIFTVIQYWYLTQALGEDAVSIGASSKPINLFSVGDIEKIGICDTFISLWALSESSDNAINFVIDQYFFDANNIIMAYQNNNAEFPFAERIGEGLYIYPMEHLPGNYYAFR